MWCGVSLVQYEFGYCLLAHCHCCPHYVLPAACWLLPAVCCLLPTAAVLPDNVWCGEFPVLLLAQNGLII
jgi:hypothetical protein